MSVVLVLLAVALPSTFSQLTFYSPNSGQPYGSPGWQYYSTEAEDVASKLTAVVTSSKAAWENYVNTLKVSNNASKALTAYVEAGNSVDGTACAPSDDDQYRSSIVEKIHNTVDSCAAFSNFTCGGHFCTLIELIREALVEVQKADSDLGNSRIFCFSLRVAPSPACVESQKKSLETINHAVSHGQMAKYNYESRESYFPAIAKLDACVDHGLARIQAELEGRTQGLIDCKKSL
ncbi:hypothetical protein J6590_094785 [Homalodisca vitripennis]|nr:hypothetical protein J6590_094785 [Homalodisca vitripennis]